MRFGGWHMGCRLEGSEVTICEEEGDLVDR